MRRLADYIAETKARVGDRGAVIRFLYAVGILLLTRGAAFAWDRLGLAFGKRYKGEVVANTDFRKFDGILRLVMDVSPKQRRLLEVYLKRKTEQGKLLFGMNHSKSAVMTCLIFDRFRGNHLHFVDGSAGGFAEAAVQHKRRRRAITESPTEMLG